MAKVQFYEKGISANRNLIALIIISFTMVGIILISWFYFSKVGRDSEDAEKIFNTLIPLFATWIGTVLAFYFGRENFEAASNRYEQMIDRLGPEVLDDVFVNQIMISRETMVSKQLADIKNDSLKEIVNFMGSVEKKRLPILDGDKALYVIHKSTFTEAIAANTNEDLTLEKFVAIDKYKPIITSFITMKEDSILEDVVKRIAKENIKDIFILDSNEKLVGWLTDSLILRFLKST